MWLFLAGLFDSWKESEKLLLLQGFCAFVLRGHIQEELCWVETGAGRREKCKWVPNLELGWREIQVGSLLPLGDQEGKLRNPSSGEAWRLGN